MINSWNSVVKTNDIVYVIGDFSFGNKEDTAGIVNQLKGIKKIILGNHDQRMEVKDYFDIGFSDVRTEDIIKLGNGEAILLKHYPYNPSWLIRMYYKYIKRSRDRLHYNHYPANRGLWLISGHHHGAPFLKGKTFNVSCETLNYKPVSETIICQKINRYKNETLTFKILRVIKKVSPRKIKKCIVRYVKNIKLK